MKKSAPFLAGFAGFVLSSVFAAEPPRGSLLELHSCEVYAGGCIVSSEAQSGGYMLRAWSFNGGSFEGADFAGLRFAVLQLSADNLASPGSASGRAVVYLPQSATPRQRESLVAWLKSTQPDFHPAQILERVTPVELRKTQAGYSLRAGDYVSLDAAPFAYCESFNCGEALWYHPRSETTVFTVAVDRSSQVTEPLLKLRWDDHGRRNLFMARFGAPESARDEFVSLAELCGNTKTLF